MSCESCYNGCVQTVSDECVRYTGINYEALGVETGDNLVSVEQAIMNALVPLLTGTGDAIGLSISCPIVDLYLPAHTPNTQELFTATVSAICSLQAQIFTIDDILTILNADYAIDCLTGVTSSSDTHAIVQAIINKLCLTVTDLAALTLDVNTNYVKLADLDALIAAYIASQSGGSSNQQYLKMVPYVAYEYYGSLTNFDGTGAGLNSAGFYKVYLCNGLNGTPDRRGRVGVGAIQNVPGGPLDAAVNPANPGNPNYAIFNTGGANTVTLITSQIPSHSHSATATSIGTISPNPHSHSYAGVQVPSGQGDGSRTSVPLTRDTSSVSLTVDISTSVTNTNTGGGAAHSNIQPVIAAYYIMYIP
jgi:microcystin-dependent protein